MGVVPSEKEMLAAAEPLLRAGIAVHWLHRRSKRPVGDDWQTAKRHSLASLKRDYRSGFNLGVRPGEISKTEAGYLHVIDVDIRKVEAAAEAWAFLLNLWPDARSFPYAISGSGGESLHIYFFTDTPFKSTKLGKSDSYEMVYDPAKNRDVKKADWEIELFGAPKQLVLPPSIHPDTGLPYRWGRMIDLSMIEFGIAPTVDSTLVASWGGRDDLDLNGDDDDDLFALMRASPMGLTDEEVDKTVADLPIEWVEDHDTWLQVGMALSHEYEGGQKGFDRWCEWSRRSTKFDIKEHKTRWKSFKQRTSAPVRMATLIKAAGEARLIRGHDELNDLDDLFQVQMAPTAVDVVTETTTQLPALIPDTLDELFGSFQSVKPGVSAARDLPPVDPEWKSYLQRNEEGAIKPTLHNVELIVRNDTRLRGVIGFNEFTQEIVLIREPATFRMRKAGPKPVRQLDDHIWRVQDPVNGDLWSDSHDIAIRLILEAPIRQGGYELKTSDRDLHGAIDRVGHANRFHPIRDYLSGLKWDGVRRMETLFIDYVGADDNAYHREAAAMWLLGAVTRAFEPGHKFDFVPILEGLQGKRKSTFFKAIGRHWFAELEGDFHDTKAMVEKMQGAWILEIPELQGFSKSEVTIIKGFVSRQKDKIRLAYAKRAAMFARQCVFGGTTNDVEYLRDSSGGRRFWPVACRINEIDTDRLELNIDQIWAEAMALYHEWRRRYGPAATLPLYMKNPVAADYAKAMQESRRQIGSDEVLAARIEEWLSKPIGDEFEDLDDAEKVYRDEICLAQVWVEMMHKDINAQTDRDQQMLGRAMRKVEGWEMAGQARFPGYGKQRRFVRIDAQ